MEDEVLLLAEPDPLGRVLPGERDPAVQRGPAPLDLPFEFLACFGLTGAHGAVFEDPVAVGIGGWDGQGKQAAEGQEEDAFHRAGFIGLWDSAGGYSRGRSRNLPWARRPGCGRAAC